MKQGPAIPITLPQRFNLTGFYLEDNIACGRGSHLAVHYRDRRYSFDEISRLTNKFGNVLKSLGVGLGDRVLLVLRDSPEWLAAWFATMKIGGVATHAYTYLASSDYEYLIDYVAPRVVVVDGTTLHTVRSAAQHCKDGMTLLVAGDELPFLENGEHHSYELLAQASDQLAAEHADKDNVAFWNFSGGTTGRWKGVPHRHSHGAIGFECFNSVIRFTRDDVVLRVPKLFFHYARDLGMNWPLRNGASVCLAPERTTAELIFELIEKHRPSVLVNVPTMMRAMLQSPLSKRADLSCLRLCLSSGELLSEQLYREFSDRFGVEVINAHGSAETYLPYFMDQPGAVRPGSSGKLMPLVDVKLVDKEGNEVAEGETGVLWVRSDASGWCYHHEAEKTAETFRGNGWVNTNDLFREDKDGYYWFMGRANDMIKVSGIYVAPLEIEQRLAEHPAVAECIVLAVKDSDNLLKTKAFIVPKAGFAPSDRLAKELNQFCRQTMAGFKAPKFIQFLSDLPKTGQGKIDKRRLLAAATSAEDEVQHAFAAV